MNWTLEEHMHALEEEHEKTLYCPYEDRTGDKKYPVLCRKDNRYATRAFCDACAAKRKEENDE